MAPVSVVRIGPFKDGKGSSQLRQTLLKHFESLCNSGNDTSPAPLSMANEHHLHISNRYFTAQVALTRLGDDDDTRDESRTEDGIILVFDLLAVNTNETTSFDTLQSDHEQAVANDTAGDLLRLCVGVGDRSILLQTMSEKNYEKEYSRRVLWCLDRGYEYVEADLSEEGVKNGHDVRDKEGFARIVEAIAGTVWSSAVMEKRKQQELKETYADDRESTEAAMATSSDTCTDSVETGTYEPPDPSTLPPLLSDKVADLERERLARDSLLTEPSASGANMDANTSQGEEVQQERTLNALEHSMSEARRLREQSTAGELSDEERRKRAGDAAVLIMNMMEQLGFDEEESDNEENEIATGDGNEVAT